MAGNAKLKKTQKTSKISARKRARQSEKRHLHNVAMKTRMKHVIRDFRAAITSKKKTDAEALLSPTLSVIARMASKGIIHRNTAARYSSRLVQQFNQL
ncbi:MAG: 30S ribosomal protein S20 [Deltaproteobacteria bacterium]|nr:30S ribosomal protein S20 [Deltaproteobacteria bacterium]